jgi:hypothetical protein
VADDAAGELERLLGLPLDEFTAARTEAARRLRAEGRRDEAEAVQALRKPTLPVWALNQAARREPGDVRALVQAAERVRQDPAAAERDFRAALADVVAEARRALVEVGQAASDATVQRVTTTARAAAATLPQELVRGVLREELEPAGFEVLAAGSQVPPRRKATARPRDDASERRRRVEAATRELQAARTEARRLAKEAHAAERAAAKAREAAARAEEEVRRAVERLDAARDR